MLLRWLIAKPAAGYAAAARRWRRLLPAPGPARAAAAAGRAPRARTHAFDLREHVASRGQMTGQPDQVPLVQALVVRARGAGQVEGGDST
jgi:hypothetical protein